MYRSINFRHFYWFLGLIRIQEIISNWPESQEPITYFKLDPDGDNKETFKYIFNVTRISHHIIDCHVDRISKYMKEIVDVENSTKYQVYAF